jgi:hypothetical protein
MLNIDIKSILSGYSESLNAPSGKIPIQVKNCITAVLGISNVTLPLSCAWGLTSSVNYEYIRNCLSQYGTFTDQQIQALIDCISNCRVGVTVSSQDKGLFQWKDCCNNSFTQFINNETLTITGCVKTNSVQSYVGANNQSITLSAVTYGSTNCDCPPPSPTPTPTVTPTLNYTPTPTPTPTSTLTPTPTSTVTPTPTKSPFVYIPITPIIPFPTPTSSPFPTPTPSPSSGIPTIGCGTPIGFTASNAIIGPKTFMYKVNLGTQIGNVTLNFDLKTCNDRATVIYDGQAVIETGCQGQYYEACWSDPQCNTGELLAPWNNPYIIPSTVTDVNNGNVSPGNIQENQNSGECNHKISFYKSAASPTFAYLVVKSPSPHTLNYNGVYICDKTIWNGSLSCPDGNTFNFLGPESLKLLTTQQQYNCLTGNTLTPMTIPVNTVLTILPSWGYPPGGGSLGNVKHTVWVEGASAVSNPAGVYAPANGSPNWVVTSNPQTVYDIVIPTPQLPPTTFNGTRFYLASNVSSGPWDITLQCGTNAGMAGQLYGNTVHYFKPFSVKYTTPGVYDITVKVWRQNSTDLNCGWYRYKNYITVVP